MDRQEKREMIARRIARDLKDGFYVNLGIGIPTLVANYIPEGKTVHIESENGILGVGPEPPKGEEDREMINAGGGFITAIKGAATFDSFTSFSMIRGGHLDMAVLGSLQVDQEGNIANWMIPGKRAPGMGGAMDLVSGAKEVVVAMEHVNRKGESKVLKKCTLPLTGMGVVDLIVTDMAAIRVTPEGLLLLDVAVWTSVEEVIKHTEADLIVPAEVGVFQ